MRACVGECEAAAGDEVFDGLRAEHLRWVGKGSDPRACRHGDAGALSFYQFALTSVDAGPYLDVEIMDSVTNFLSAVDGSGGAVEGRIEAVACSVVFASAPGGECVSD